jgi:hypothetical protein
MPQDFDPYYRWLGIPPEKQPPHHYSLLGIDLFEDDPDVIETAANRQMGHLRTYQTGKYSPLSQKLLNEVAAAKICLLTPTKKQAYDRALRSQLEADAAPAVVPESSATSYSDRLLLEAHAKLSQADVRRLELEDQRRTKTAILIGSVGGVLLVSLALVILLVWFIVARGPSHKSWVEQRDAAGPASAQSSPQATPEAPAASEAAPIAVDPAEHPNLLVLPDSVIEKPRRPGGPGTGSH